MPRVLGLGDNTVDYYLHRGVMYPGGNALNVAVLARRYGCEASYLGWVGDDARGELLLSALHAEDVDSSHVRVKQGPSSISKVNLVEGDRVFSGSDHGVTKLIKLESDDYAFIQEHDAVHCSIYSHLEDALPDIADVAKRLSFDFSNHASEDYLRAYAPHVDTAFLSAPDLDDGQLEDFMRWLQGLGPSLVVATRGAKGAVAYDGQTFYHQAVSPTEVVDTLGAGDAFSARLLTERLKNASFEAALACAAASAAQTCSYYGAFGHGVPFAKEDES